jgi:transposase
VAHEVTNLGYDRGQLSGMAWQARETMGHKALTVIADRGYYKGEDILLCEQDGMTPLVPKTLTSGAKADGRFDKQDFTLPTRAGRLPLPSGRDHEVVVQPCR